MRPAQWIGKAASLTALTLSLGCTQDVAPEKTADENAALQLWTPIDVVEQVNISASADKIWSILIDVNDYAQWNPWLTQAHDATSSTVQVGDTIDATVILSGRASAATEAVTVVTPPGTAGQPAGQLAQFCWRDAIPITSTLVPAYRCRTLYENSDGSVRVVNDLTLQGVIDWFAWLLEVSTLKTGMSGENDALKARAEQ
jgi:hypothetical protein